jgi:hypothetical protein
MDPQMREYYNHMAVQQMCVCFPPPLPPRCHLRRCPPCVPHPTPSCILPTSSQRIPVQRGLPVRGHVPACFHGRGREQCRQAARARPVLPTFPSLSPLSLSLSRTPPGRLRALGVRRVVPQRGLLRRPFGGPCGGNTSPPPPARQGQISLRQPVLTLPIPRPTMHVIRNWWRSRRPARGCWRWTRRTKRSGSRRAGRRCAVGEKITWFSPLDWWCSCFPPPSA